VQVLGSTELKTIELPDLLQFVYGYEAGWGDLVAPPAALLAALVWAWTTGHHIFVAIFIVIFGGLAFYWINITPTRLSVSLRELVSRGNHNRNIKAEVTVPASSIQSFEYFPLSANGAAGLYAQCGQKQVLLIPGLTQEQASEVVNTIRARYPQLEQNNSARTSPGYSEPASGAYISLTGLPPSQPKP
jgi:hypothetical protein